MKKKIYSPLVRLTFMLLLLMGTCIGARAGEGVVLKLKDGQEVAFAFSGKPCISTGEALTITMPDGTNVSYAYADVSSIRFGSFTITGIDETPSAEGVDVSFRIDGAQLSVSLPARGVLVIRTSTGISYRVMNP